MGITEVVTAPRSPWQNAYVERVIGSIRRECLDHVIVFNERHLPPRPDLGVPRLLPTARARICHLPKTARIPRHDPAA